MSRHRPYVARRIVSVVPVWIGISVLAFILGHLAPGDPGEAILSGELGRPPTPGELVAFDHKLGLDRPAIIQYWHWLVGTLHGDLGRSYQTGQSVLGVITTHMVPTLVLAGCAFAAAVTIAVPLGTWAALRAGCWPDSLTRTLAVGSAGLPSFWVGYLLIVVFAVLAPLLPAQGDAGARSIILPAATLAIAVVGVPLRLVRASVLEVLGEDHVRTARSLGLPERKVLLGHVLPNALMPIVTYLGVILAMLLSGAVVIETVFSWPGVGLAVTSAIHARDYPVVQGFVLFTGTVFVVVSLGVDLLYILIDPRVRLGGAAGG